MLLLSLRSILRSSIRSSLRSSLPSSTLTYAEVVEKDGVVGAGTKRADLLFLHQRVDVRINDVPQGPIFEVPKETLIALEVAHDSSPESGEGGGG